MILSTGRCSGEVICGDLVVEAGGRLDAKVTCKEPVRGKKKAADLYGRAEATNRPRPYPVIEEVSILA